MFRAAIIWCLTATAGFAACNETQATIQGDFGIARFDVEVVDTPEERGVGLMFREEMATLSGMLFIYERPQTAAFWMRNTLIPLDMIFVDETGRIAHIHQNAIPGDLTTILGGDDILVVLEINGGLAARLGIEPGDALQHPSFDQDSALLPCAAG